MNLNNNNLGNNEKILKFDKLIIKNGIFNALNLIVVNGINFILSVFLARVFTQEYYGSFQLIRQIFSILMILSIPGLKIVIFKNLAQNYGGEYSKSIKLRLKGSLIATIVCIIIGVYILIYKNSNYNNFD